MKTIQQLDFLGEKPKLFINNYINHKTKLGGILSIISFIVLFSAVIFFTKILFERSNFSVMVNEQLNPDSLINWTNKELSIIVLDRLGNSMPDSDRIYGITGTFYYWKVVNDSDVKGATEQIKMEKCEYERNFLVNNELWKREYGIVGSWCIEKGQNFLSTQKTLGSTNSSIILLNIHMCINTTLKNDCFPEDVIKQKLANTFTTFKITDVYFDHNDKDKTAKSYIFTDTFQTSISVYKRLYYTFKIIDYFSDDNYFLTDNNISSYVTIADNKEAVDLRPLNSTYIPNTFLAISLSNNYKKQIYYRKYYKAQNLMADLGGIIKAILLIATILNNIFVERLYYNDIINYNLSSMNISIENKNGKLNFIDTYIKSYENKLIEIKPLENIEIKNISINNKILKSNNLNLIDKKQKIDLPLYIMSIPRCVVSKKSKFKNLLEKLFDLTKIIKKQLDIRLIIAKLHNIDKITYLFFGEGYSLIEGSPNPYLQQNNTNDKNSFINITDNYDNLNNNIIRNFKNLLNIKE